MLFPRNKKNDDAFIVTSVGALKLFSRGRSSLKSSCSKGVDAPSNPFLLKLFFKKLEWFMPGFPGTSILLPSVILRLKGYRIVGTLALDMPVNWTAAVPPQGKKKVDSIIGRGKKITDEFSEKMLSNQKPHYPLWLLPLCLITIPFSIAYMIIGRFFLAKLFFASSKCNGCGICQKNCPVSAIRMKGKRPFWTFKCESCQRCINFCPNHAVEVSPIFAVLVILVAHPLLFGGISSKLGPVLTQFLGKYTPIAIYSIWYLAFFLLFFIMYGLFFAVTWFKPVYWLFTHSSITRYYGRYREPGTKVQDFS